jgi:hypothetical protein
MKLTSKEIDRRRSIGEGRATVYHHILYEIRIRGYNNKSLAKALGCSESLVSKVLTGKKHSPLVLNGLQCIGVSEYLLFDPRYMEIVLWDVNSESQDAAEAF